MSKLENAMDKVLDVFKKEAGKDGKNKMMTKERMKDLLERELEQWRQKCKNKDNFKSILNELDTNKKEHVDFKVFVNYVARLMVCSDCYFYE